MSYNAKLRYATGVCLLFCAFERKYFYSTESYLCVGGWGAGAWGAWTVCVWGGGACRRDADTPICVRQVGVGTRQSVRPPKANEIFRNHMGVGGGMSAGRRHSYLCVAGWGADAPVATSVLVWGREGMSAGRRHS